LVVLTFLKNCRVIQKARVHKSQAILIAGPPFPYTHCSSWDMAREGKPKSTFCAFYLRTPTESACLCRRCAQLCRRRWLLCRRRSRLRDDWALNSIVELQGSCKLNCAANIC